MTYTEYRDTIRNELRRNRRGFTWPELKERLALPHSRPCPEWTKKLEVEIGLRREKRTGRALVWRIG